MRSFFILSALIGTVALLPGCASIVSGNGQALSVDAKKGADSVKGATCKLENGSGTYFVTTPGTVQVKGSSKDMAVACEKAGTGAGTAAISPSLKPMTAGNLVFGGIIGVAVDLGTGAAFEYPSVVTVMLSDDAIKAPVEVAQAEAGNARQ